MNCCMRLPGTAYPDMADPKVKQRIKHKERSTTITLSVANPKPNNVEVPLCR